MANTNKAFGLRPLAKLGSNVNSDGDTQYRIVSNTTDAIFQGDTVTLSGGYVVKATPGAANILGVFLGCQYTDPTTKKTTFKNYYPGAVVASDIVATVVDDPNALFLVQASGVAAVTCVGKNADLVQTAAGSTTTGVSGLELSTGTLGTSADLNVKVVGISSVPGEGDVTSAYANLIVKINEHLYSAATAGV
jgi:MFS-type transporter involved in bile tolerance (Atg22 family)